MDRYWTIGLALFLGVLAGTMIESSLSRVGIPSLGQWANDATPAVSAAPVAAPESVDVQYAAEVEIDGDRFRIFVGRTAGSGLGVQPVWSVAVPIDRYEK